jgi:polyhydroxybutyrate depolymerase
MHLRTILALVVTVFVASACSNGSTNDRRSATASPTCHPKGSVGPGEEKVSVTSRGAERSYIRHVPPSYRNDTPMPVVLDFHGYAEGADIHVKMSGLGAFGDSKGFITITPAGLGPVPHWDFSLDGADMAFTGDLLDDVESTLCVDTRRIFVDGLSNGAFMTSAIACRYADRVAAAAPVAGIMDIPGCKPARPIPIVAFHGTADKFVSFDGGLGSAVASLPAPDGSGRSIGSAPPASASPAAASPATPKPPTVPEIVAAWAKRDGCQPNPTETKIGDDVVHVVHPCPPGMAVELYRIEGGGHAWPGSPFSQQVANFVGKTTMTISADEVMWDFFVAHPLPT